MVSSRPVPWSRWLWWWRRKIRRVPTSSGSEVSLITNDPRSGTTRIRGTLSGKRTTVGSRSQFFRQNHRKSHHRKSLELVPWELHIGTIDFMVLCYLVIRVRFRNFIILSNTCPQRGIINIVLPTLHWDWGLCNTEALVILTMTTKVTFNKSQNHVEVSL